MRCFSQFGLSSALIWAACFGVRLVSEKNLMIDRWTDDGRSPQSSVNTDPLKGLRSSDFLPLASSFAVRLKDYLDAASNPRTLMELSASTVQPTSQPNFLFRMKNRSQVPKQIIIKVQINHQRHGRSYQNFSRN